VCHSQQDADSFTGDIAEFEAGRRRHLVFVTIVSEGVDIPAIDAVVLLRPTKSPVLLVQTVGRAMRPHSGKTNGLILDYGSCFKNCGPIDEPFIRVRGAIGESPKTVAEARDYTVEVCASCGSIMFPVKGEPATCHMCGHVSVFEDKQLTKNLKSTAAPIERLYAKALSKAPERKWYKVEALDFLSSEVTTDCALMMQVRYKVEGGTLTETITVPGVNDMPMQMRAGKLARAKKHLAAFGLEWDRMRAEPLVPWVHVKKMPQMVYGAPGLSVGSDVLAHYGLQEPCWVNWKPRVLSEQLSLIDSHSDSRGQGRT
jgi:hypothetical protein